MYSPIEAPTTEADSPFAAVPAALRPALERRGFASLTAVQHALLAAEVGTRDLQVTSQTGSGKTLAIGFAIAPTLMTPADGVQPGPRTGPLALVIAPTRELAIQVATELEWLFADQAHITIDCATGGTNVGEERRRLQRPPTILVGTPGRLLDHATSGALQLSTVCQLVLDEADQMLDLGFRDELEAILDQLSKERRSILVSATFPPGVRSLTKRYQRDPLHIEGTALGSANQDIEHIAHLINARDRYGVLVNHLLLATERRVLVFVRTREDTTSLADKLDGDGFRAAPLSGDLTQAQRTRTLAAFKRGTIQVLVATDVAARGLDIPDVASVMHMEAPIDSAAYTHRSGRTGRAGQKGTSVILVPRAREAAIRRLLQHAGVRIQWRAIPTADDVRALQRNQLVAQVEKRRSEGLGAADLAIAGHLAEQHPPAEVIAALLAELAARQGRQPVEFASAPGMRPMPGHSPHKAAPVARAVARPAAAPVAQKAVAQTAVSEMAVAQNGETETVREPAPALPSARPAPELVVSSDLETEAETETETVEVRQQKPFAGADRPSPAPRRATANNGRFVRFRINWGLVDGAEPRRILAHVCRRGAIESHQVGAIELERYESIFAVAEPVADAFAKAVRARDARDPHLVIHPEGVASHFRGPRGPRAPFARPKSKPAFRRARP
jgi:ATP-dependent RNA helicase DeaD